jgi:hypothetical protein
MYQPRHEDSWHTGSALESLKLASAFDPELPVPGLSLLTSNPILHLATLGLSCHRVILNNLRVECLAFRTVGLCWCICNCRIGDGGRAACWLTLLFGQLHLQVEGQVVWDTDNALNQGVVFVAVSLGPEVSPAIGSTEVKRISMGIEWQQAD